MAEPVEDGSREELVSTLMNISETLCEKAMAIEESGVAKDLVKRGRALQKKNKQSSSTDRRKRTNEVEINCCLMECGRRGYTKSSAIYEVQLSKDDSYHSVIRKISRSIGIDDCEENELRLFNGRGGIIPDGCITLRDKVVDWSLGAFLLKRHTSADKLTLGIGIVDEELEPVISISKKAKVCSSTNMITEPLRKAAADQNVSGRKVDSKSSTNDIEYQAYEASNNDGLQIYYSSEDSIIPITREEVWEEINGAENAVNGFIPEQAFYRLISIVLLKDNDPSRKIPVLKRDSSTGLITPVSKGATPFCFTSCTKPILSSLKFTPIIALSPSHPNCTYKWQCLNNPEKEYPSTPVIYNNDPLLFKCSVSVDGHVKGTAHFDVSFQPLTDFSDGDITESIHSKQSSPHPRYEILSIPPPTFDSLQFFLEEIISATDDFDKSREIGKGGYGRVYLAKDLRSIGTKAAVKVLSKEGSEAMVRGSSESQQIETELKALMKFRHQNILEIMGYCFCSELKALVYRYMENGSLYLWIHKADLKPCALSWPTRRTIIRDVLMGVAYLHAGEKPLIHQDIKSTNVLLDKEFRAVVGDFGFALELPKTNSGRTLVTAPLIARTEGYYPPELISGNISPLCDVYSCGVLTLEVYTGLKPYSKNRDDHELVNHTEDDRKDYDKFKLIADSRIEEIGDSDCNLFWQLTTNCLKRYTKRPTANEALKLFN